MKQFVTFSLNKELFAIEILYVRELNQVVDITPVQRSKEYVRGLINLRGQIVTIFDVGLRLGLEARQVSGVAHNIILKTNGELGPIRAHENRPDLESSDDPAGFLIDTFGDVLEVEDNEIEASPANIDSRQEKFIHGIFKNDKDLFTILDVSTLVAVDSDN